MTIDFDALQAHQGPKAVLTPATPISEPGSSDAVQGFDGLESVYVEVSITFIRAVYGPGSLTLLLESSSNGTDWATAHTFTFTNDGVASTTLDTPPDYLRLRWTVANRSEWWLLSAFAAPPVINDGGGGGGGGSQPVQSVTVTVPSAWIIAHSTGDDYYDLLAAVPGQGWLIVGASAKLVFNTTEYSGVFGTDDTDLRVYLKTGNLDSVILQAIPLGFWDASDDAVVMLSPVDNSGSGGMDNHIGCPVQFRIVGGGLIDGDSDLEVTLLYRTIT